jgi:phospholipid/cholesterol/gamma-HCH transport system substrate-binding protein
MKPFRERNPVPIGAIGLLIIVALLAAAFNVSKLPFIGGGDKITADFKNASGLQNGDDVLLAGVRIGKVDSISLDGNKVQVGMTVSHGTQLGAKPQADVRIQTLLGKMYVAITPSGTGSVKGTIPLSRTTTPTDVIQAFTGLGSTLGAIDTKQLAKAFDTISSTFAHTPSEVHSSLVGLQRLSTTIASRNQQLQTLLSDSATVTSTLAARDTQVASLITDSNKVLDTVYEQRQVIHSLLIHTRQVSDQLAGLVKDNEKILGPALTSLQGTLKILNDNQTALDQSLHLAAPFIRNFTDILGNGRWFETVVANLGPSLLTTSCINTGGVALCPPGASTGTSSGGTSSDLGSILGGLTGSTTSSGSGS